MGFYYARYYAPLIFAITPHPFLLLHSHFTFGGFLSINIHQIPRHKLPLSLYHFVCNFLLFISNFIIIIYI
nr:MAG TPA: hypothetical protein [Caudoviricetes sp.]